MNTNNDDYLTNMPTDVINNYGLSKTLLTRRETIYLKHILKNVFVYGNEHELLEKLELLQFKSLFQYIEFLTNRLRGIYKLPRKFQVHSVDELVKQNRNSFIKILDLYKSIKPIVIIDFDKTITNKKFHPLYDYIYSSSSKIIINSDNPSEETIINYLNKHNLQKPDHIFANRGKKRKIVKLKEIAIKNPKKVIFYIDNEIDYLDYGCLLGLHCYEYNKQGKIHNRTIFEK